MTLQDQCCTLEQATQLAVLGIKQKSAFYHAINSYNQDYKKVTANPDRRDIIYSAFNVAELGVMLPDYYPSWRFKFKDKSKWIATVICSPKPNGIDDIHTAHEFDRIADTQAEALATLLIALLEENIITAEEVNQNLNQNIHEKAN